MWCARWLVLAAFLVPGRTQAAPPPKESPLARVPAKAVIVFHLRGVQGTQDRLLTLARKSLPKDVAAEVEGLLTKARKDLLAGRQLKGLPPDGPAFLVFLAAPLERPAFIVRVRDYTAFRDGLLTAEERKSLRRHSDGCEETTFGQPPTTACFAHHKGYAILAPDREVVRQLLKQQRGLDSKLAADDARRFLAADFSVYAHAPAVRKAYGEGLKKARTFVVQALAQGRRVQPGEKGVEEMTDLLFRALTDSQAILEFVEFRPEGAALQMCVDVAPASPTARLLKGFKPTAMAEVARLPAGGMSYSAMRVEPALLEAFPTWLYGVSITEGGERGKAAQEAQLELARAKPRLLLSCAGMPLQEIVVWQYDDAARAVKARLRLLESLRAGDALEGALLYARPEVRANAEAYRGFQFHYARMAWDIEGTFKVQGTGKLPEKDRKEMIAALKKLIGEGRTMWFGTDGKVFLQVTAADWAEARRSLDRYLDGKDTVGGQPAFQEARKHLPAETTVLSLVEFSAYVRLMREAFVPLIRATGTPGAKLPPLPVPSDRPCYFGTAFTLRPGRGTLDLWLSAEAIGEFYKTMEPVFKIFKMAPDAP
jgi:hypothetical protein